LAGKAVSPGWLRAASGKIAAAVERPYRSTVRRAASSLGLSIGLALLAVITAAGVVFVLGWATLGHLLYATDPTTHRRGLDIGHVLDSVKIGLAVVAGLGAAVGLTVSYRKQRGEEDKAFTDRYAAAAEQLGHGKAAVRLAGVYALARLADDWEPHRQTCIDVLCAYLRMPYDPESPEPGEREVRLTVIRLIRDHLRPTARVSWSGRDLDFTGTVFDGGDFSGATFSGGTVGFDGATFSGGTVGFDGATFSGGTVSFGDATFSGGTVNFSGATFSGGTVSFSGAGFSGGTVNFFGARFSGGTVSFSGAGFSGGTVNLSSPGDWSVPPSHLPPSAPGLLLPEGRGAVSD
jgi:Pentapeptide repeats (9 copies)